MTNPYCEILRVEDPSVETAVKSPDASYYGLLIAVLLERGAPVTLQEAAQRLEEAGVAPAAAALASLKRCRPARSPVYRDGDLYALDPHDREADLWAFRLGLRPPKVPRLRVARPEPGPLPSADARLTVAHLDEAWREGIPSGWSAQRLALCVLDAAGKPMPPDDVVSFVSARGQRSPLSVGSARYWGRGAAVHPGDDGLWQIEPGHDALRSARQAVRERIEAERRRAEQRFDPVVAAATMKRVEKEREARVEQVRRMRHAVVHGFPAKKPEAVVLIDVAQRSVAFFFGDEISAAVQRLADFDFIAAIDVRRLLRTLGCEPGARRLCELGPPQKTMTINKQGRKLKITTRLLVQGSCGIGHPLGEEDKMLAYFHAGELTKLRRRLEADAKSLYALYQYGRLHGTVRLRWGFIDERIAAPWVDHDEVTIHHLKREAHERGRALEVVVGSAPGWSEPWSRVQRAHVVNEGWHWWLVDDAGYAIDEEAIQLARLAGTAHCPT